MNFVGIITEYDPFHNGHAAQLAAVRRAGGCMHCGLHEQRRSPAGRCAHPAGQRPCPGPALEAGGRSGHRAAGALWPAPRRSRFAAAGSVFCWGRWGVITLAFGAETPEADRLMQAAQLLREPALQTETAGSGWAPV